MTDPVALLEGLLQRDKVAAHSALMHPMLTACERDAILSAIALMRAPVGDADRFAFIASKARQDRAYDIFGNGGHWGIGLHSPDGNLSFREAVDHAMQQTETK